MPANIVNNKALGRFSEDPENSWTLPGSYYYDPQIYLNEQQAIFNRSWQYACHSKRLTKRGQYFVRDIGDQSVLVLRDKAGEIRAFHNVCQHRAHRLCEGSGKITNRITCPYHNWSYALSGELEFARGSEGVADFPINDISLQAVKVDSICGFIFFNLDGEAKSMAEVYPGLENEILELAPDATRLELSHEQNFLLKANWKNSIENYSECYHCPNQHPSLVGGALDITQYRIKINQGYHRHVTSGVGDKQGYTLKQQDGEKSDEFGSWLVWPNMVFEVYPGGNLTVFHHVPDGPESTRQETEWYFANKIPTAEEKEVIEFVNVVREEDIPICESVQRGLHSQGYQQGRFIVDRDRTYMSEHAVHDFQLNVIRALEAAEAGKE
jgi:phenylpropionate dioxygenase-like ring-hydroxylating dioxygenase large terminal subunit